MAIPIQNTEQDVDKKKYDKNFDEAFGVKPVQKGKWVVRNGKLVPAGKNGKPLEGSNGE